MLVKCNKIISPTTKKDLGDSSPWLKRDSEYIVLSMSWSSKFGIQILIQSEHYNEPCFVNLDGFEIISQKIPTTWITTTEESDDELIFMMMPKSWSMYENFFEDVENEVREAVLLFNKEAVLIYNEENLL